MIQVSRAMNARKAITVEMDRPGIYPGSTETEVGTIYRKVSLSRAVKLRLDAEGISIPFPQRDVHFFKEDSPAAPGVVATDPAADRSRAHEHEAPPSTDADDDAG